MCPHQARQQTLTSIAPKTPTVNISSTAETPIQHLVKTHETKPSLGDLCKPFDPNAQIEAASNLPNNCREESFGGPHGKALMIEYRISDSRHMIDLWYCAAGKSK